MIDVNCELQVYEINGEDVSNQHTHIHMTGHHNFDDRVVLRAGGKSYTVIAKDLKAAIENCTNTGKF